MTACQQAVQAVNPLLGLVPDEAVVRHLQTRHERHRPSGLVQRMVGQPSAQEIDMRRVENDALVTKPATPETTPEHAMVVTAGARI